MRVLNKEEFPSLLAQAGLGYTQLWLKGQEAVLHKTCISIVGTRRCTAYGRAVVDLLVPGLVRAGLSIVSGLALGIDAYVHRSALQVGGGCIAVLGSGLQAVYPATNRLLAQQIAENGLLLSAYAPSVTARPYHFPERNRIIAALSLVTLVIEAREDSGSLITARAAISMNREVAAIPADITRDTALGCIQLLQQGAKPVASVSDILQLYQQSLPIQLVTEIKPALTGTMGTLYATISNGAHRVDEMLRLTGLPLITAQNALTLLEIEGYICQRQQEWHVIS